MPELVLILCGYALLTAAILQLGRALVRFAPDMPVGPGPVALAWVLGSGVFGLGVLLLAAVHWLDGVSLSLLCAAALASGGLPPSWRRMPRPVWSLPTAVCLLFLAVHFVISLAPGDDADGYRYHLGFPHLYRHAGGLIAIPEDFYAAFPQAVEMLYVAALQFGGFSVANLLHWNFLLALVLGVYATGEQWGAGWAGAVAAAAVAASPLTGTTVAAAGVDYALAAAFWLCFDCLLRWRKQRRAYWLLVAAGLAGLCCGMKYTGIVAVALVLLMAATTAWPAPRKALAAIGIAAVPITPWLVRNWLFYSNPVHPFLSATFPNPHLLPSSEAALIANVRAYEGVAFSSRYYWEATMRGVETMGFAGPYFLLAPLGLLALRTALGRWVLAGGLLAALPWIFGNPVLRFAVPAMPFLALAIALGMATLPLARILLLAILIVQSVMCFPLFIERWNKQFGVAFKEVPWRGALRLEAPETYWSRRLPTYTALRFLETNAPANARVLAMDAQDQFFTTRLLASPYGSEHSSLAIEMLDRAVHLHELPNVRCAAPVKGTARYLRLEQLQSDKAPWVVHRLWIPEGAQMTANPNPWDAALVIDASDVTAWSSKEPRQAGMRIEAQWPVETAIGEVAVQTSGYHLGRTAVSVSRDGETWSAAQVLTDCSVVDLPRFTHRTVRQIRRLGWTHILATRDYTFLTEMIADPERFGVDLVFQDGPTRLIRLR